VDSKLSVEVTSSRDTTVRVGYCKISEVVCGEIRVDMDTDITVAV
jgi:hypothetical protein